MMYEYCEFARAGNESWDQGNATQTKIDCCESPECTVTNCTKQKELQEFGTYYYNYRV